MTDDHDPQRLQAIVEELKLIRRRRLTPRPAELPHLLEISRAGGRSGVESLLIEHTLNEAAAGYTDRSGQAVLILLGWTSSSQNLPAKERHRQAAVKLGYKPSYSPKTEDELLIAFAEKLLDMGRERTQSRADAQNEANHTVEPGGPIADDRLISTQRLGPPLISEALDVHAEAESEAAPDPLPSGPENPMAELTLADEVPDSESDEPFIHDARHSTRPLRKAVIGIALAITALGASLAATATWPFASAGPGSTPAVIRDIDSLSAVVRLPGQTTRQWASSARVPAGDPVEWGIDIVHESATVWNSTIMFDEVPSGVAVVPGSVRLYNGHYPNDGYTFPSSAVQDHGRQINLNIGDYLPISILAVSKGALAAQIIFDTEFVNRSPSNCASHEIVNKVWIGPSQYPRALHASARATVSC